VTASSFQIDVPQTLLARACAGDLGAFEQIYRRFERPVYTLALRLLGDGESARDVLHDAMLKVFQRIATFRGESPFWGWLRQIALNEALMRLRQHDRAESSDEIDAFVDDAPGPWSHADAGTLERALARLPAQTRSVLWLYHVEGYSHPEIAELVGKSVSFSKSQVARGTQRLREIIDPPAGLVSCLIATAH
jgi:RNA polymerase sigma factor (sigma-70 family)